MNETLPTQDSAPDAASASALPPRPVKPAGVRPARQRLLIASLLAVAALAAWQLYAVRTELEHTRAEFTRRLSDTAEAAQSAQAASRQVRDSLDGLQQRIGGIEARVTDAASQQEALQSMYQELMRARDERFVTEVEQAVGIASQQLQLAGNVPAALAALQNAEARLATQNRPQLLSVRKLVSRDIERLRAVPLADTTGIALRLETMLGVIDSLPLGFERLPQDKRPAAKPAEKPVPVVKGKKPVAPAEASAPPAAVPSNESSGFFRGLLTELWVELRQLVRIERLDRPEPILLAPQQAAYLRENLRLRLLSARLGLLQRDARSFAEDVRQSRQWLERYFDVDAAPVANMLSDLRQMEAARFNVELPSLAETEAALRSLKFGRGN